MGLQIAGYLTVLVGVAAREHPNKSGPLACQTIGKRPIDKQAVFDVCHSGNVFTASSEIPVPLTPTQIKQAKRAEKEAALAAKQLALPDKRYGVIVADPPWKFEVYSRETGLDRSADNHYATNETSDIAAMDVTSIAAKDCVLFLWATVPFLEQALNVMKSWGFRYVSSYVWVKLGNAATGYWNRGRHEYLLIGTRGHVPAPAPGTQWPSVIEAEKGAHSVKPEAALEMIEHYYPNLPKIELHRRGPARRGWDAWGNEVAS